jgi:hypothetical protein
MMNEHEVKHLLAYIQAADNRNVGNADVAFWSETLPAWLDLDTAKAAVRMFFTEPERNAESSVYFTTRHLIRCAKAVRRQREVEAARQAAKTPAITAAHKPPAEGWRARVPGGYPEPAEEPVPAPDWMTAEQAAEHRAGQEEPHVFTDEERAANRLRLNSLLSGTMSPETARVIKGRLADDDSAQQRHEGGEE